MGVLGRRRTLCRRGHPLVGGNIYVSRAGDRSCRACLNARQRMYRRRQREAQLAQARVVRAAREAALPTPPPWVGGTRGVTHRIHGVSRSTPRLYLYECGNVQRADRVQPERADTRRCAQCTRGRMRTGTYQPHIRDYYAMVGETP